MIFTNVIKPTHICNLSCRYCYNDDVRNPIMAIHTLDRTVEETFRYLRSNYPEATASFIWHGGEPMVAQLDFYRNAVRLQEQYACGAVYENSIQTNGTLIDNEWLFFFKEHDFKVSISIDGPKGINDKNRIDNRGKGSFDKVVQSIKMVRDEGMPLGLCVVISADNAEHVDEIYDLMADLRVPFNIVPVNKSGGAVSAYNEIGLDADEFAAPWISMYDRWFDADRDYVYCSDFVFKTRAIIAGTAVDCFGLQNCADNNLSVDPCGDVYPCATLSGDLQYSYGNINTQSLTELMSSPLAIAYRNRATDLKCSTCKWQHVCYGGCLARAHKFFGNHNRRDFYCPSLYQIYEHIHKKLLSRIPKEYSKMSANGMSSIINFNQQEK